MEQVETTRRLLTIEETASVLHMSRQSVRRLMNAGRLEGHKIGKMRRFLWQDIDAFLDSLKQGK